MADAGEQTPGHLLRVIGGFALSVSGRAVDLRNRKAQAIVAHLALSAPSLRGLTVVMREALRTELGVVLADGELILDGPMREVLADSLVFAPQIHKLYRDKTMMTVGDVVGGE